MPQPFPVRDPETEVNQPNRAARDGFVGAFVRSVRRGQQTSAVGKIAIGALVVVLAAGSVVGLSVLLRGTGKSDTANTAATTPGGGAGTAGGPVASSGGAKPGQAKSATPGRPGAPAQGLVGPQGVPGAPGAAIQANVQPGAGQVDAAAGGSALETPGNVASSAGLTSAAGSVTANQATAPKQATVAKNPPAAPTGAAGDIFAYAGTNMCIDVTDGATGKQLQVWTCNNGPNQRWTPYSDGSWRALGKCMTASGGSTANGTAIVLQACNNLASQKFVLNNAHDLTRSNRCVDAVNMKTTNGTRLQLWQCGGTSNQKWHR